jgi:hypothetical protein
MSRRIKLDFKPLTLSETAKALGIPPARARKILAIVGVDFNGRTTDTTRARKARTGKTSAPRSSTRRAKTAVR